MGYVLRKPTLFVEGISTGHPDMPEFVASPEQIGAIISFLDTLQP